MKLLILVLVLAIMVVVTLIANQPEEDKNVSYVEPDSDVRFLFDTDNIVRSPIRNVWTMKDTPTCGLYFDHNAIDPFMELRNDGCWNDTKELEDAIQVINNYMNLSRLE